VPIERVDYLLRGVPLSPGTHRVEFQYRPTSWTIAWILSGLAALALIALALLGWRARRRTTT
jgi:MYXO-CTERM domain-containing protein